MTFVEFIPIVIYVKYIVVFYFLGSTLHVRLILVWGLF